MAIFLLAHSVGSTAWCRWRNCFSEFLTWERAITTQKWFGQLYFAPTWHHERHRDLARKCVEDARGGSEEELSWYVKVYEKFSLLINLQTRCTCRWSCTLMRLVFGVLVVGNKFILFELFQRTILWKSGCKTAQRLLLVMSLMVQRTQPRLLNFVCISSSLCFSYWYWIRLRNGNVWKANSVCSQRDPPPRLCHCSFVARRSLWGQQDLPTEASCMSMLCKEQRCKFIQISSSYNSLLPAHQVAFPHSLVDGWGTRYT